MSDISNTKFVITTESNFVSIGNSFERLVGKRETKDLPTTTVVHFGRLDSQPTK